MTPLIDSSGGDMPSKDQRVAAVNIIDWSQSSRLEVTVILNTRRCNR